MISCEDFRLSGIEAENVQAAIAAILGDAYEAHPVPLQNMVRLQVVPYIVEMERMLAAETPEQIRRHGTAEVHIRRIADNVGEYAIDNLETFFGNAFVSNTCRAFAAHYTKKLNDLGITVALEASGTNHHRGDNPSADWREDGHTSPLPRRAHIPV